MLTTPDQQQLDRAVAIVQDVLGSELIGIYLFGSAVLGGLRPASDLDLFVAVRRATTHAEKLRLVQALMAISGRVTPDGMWRRIEVTVVVQREVNPWRYPPRLDFQYGDWLRGEFERGLFEPSPSPLKPDVAILISMVIAANAPVFGPPPAHVLPPVPRHDLRRAMLSDVDRLRGEIDSDTRNVILTLARIWSTLATDVARTKDVAADWVLQILPDVQRPVLRRARDAYLGCETERWDDLGERVHLCADYLVARIKEAGSASAELP